MTSNGSQPTSADQLPTKNQCLSNRRVFLSLIWMKAACAGYAQEARLFEKGNTLSRTKGQANVMGTLMGMTFLTVALLDGHLNWDVFYA